MYRFQCRPTLRVSVLEVRRPLRCLAAMIWLLSSNWRRPLICAPLKAAAGIGPIAPAFARLSTNAETFRAAGGACMRPMHASGRWQRFGRSTALALHDSVVAGPVIAADFNHNDQASAPDSDSTIRCRSFGHRLIDTKLNERLKKQRDALETDQDRAVLGATSAASEGKQKFVDQVEQLKRLLEIGGGSLRRWRSPIGRGSPRGSPR